MSEPVPPQVVVFETPGLIDIRAFTLMGVTAKPKSDNPIGLFGTGLKYAMATLVRLGAEPVVWIGTDKYTFFRRKDEFRGVEFDALSMRKESWLNSFLSQRGVVDLPYAASYGRNWKPWMAYRELESNTRDEQGLTYAADSDPGASVLEKTRIVIDHPEFLKAWEARDEIFLPEADREGHGIQVIDRPSNALYWRGLKVYDLPKPGVVTYNILDPMWLTEDRTLQYEHLAREALGTWVVQNDDEKVIEKIMTAGEKHWETGIAFNNHVAPSRAFHNVALRHPKNMPSSFYGYYAQHDERVVADTYDVFDAHRLPWRVKDRQVVDANGVCVFDAPYQYSGKWELAAAGILTRINLAAPRDDGHAAEPEGSGEEPE